MKKLFHKYYKEPSFKSSLKNFFSLGLFQASNYLFPLIVIPYLTRVIGIEKIGLVFLAQSIVTLFTVFTDYGFNLTATRDIAMNRDNYRRISEIVSSVYVLKFTIALVCLALYLLLIWFIQDFRSHFYLFLLSYTIVISQVLIPTWFLQGMEMMKILVYVNGISKLINLGLILWFVNSSDNYYLVNLFHGIGGVMAGIYIIAFLKSKKLFSFFIPRRAKIVFYLKDSWNAFFSNFSINTYVNSNILILKAFADPISLGYYALAEKILYVLRNFLTIFFQAIYPQASKQSKISHDAFKKLLFNFFPGFLLGLATIILLIFIFAHEVIELLSGASTEDSVYLLRVLIVIPIVIALNMPAFQTLLIYNLKNAYFKIFLLAVPVSIGMNLIAASMYGARGTAWAVLLTEIFISTGLIFVLEHNYPNFSVYSFFTSRKK